MSATASFLEKLSSVAPVERQGFYLPYVPDRPMNYEEIWDALGDWANEVDKAPVEIHSTATLVNYLTQIPSMCSSDGVNL